MDEIAQSAYERDLGKNGHLKMARVNMVETLSISSITTEDENTCLKKSK